MGLPHPRLCCHPRYSPCWAVLICGDVCRRDAWVRPRLRRRPRHRPGQRQGSVAPCKCLAPWLGSCTLCVYMLNTLTQYPSCHSFQASANEQREKYKDAVRDLVRDMGVRRAGLCTVWVKGIGLVSLHDSTPSLKSSPACYIM